MKVPLGDVGNIVAGGAKRWKRKPREQPSEDAPCALLIEGGEGLTPDAAVCRGWYVQAGDLMNGRPAWKHVSIAERWLTFDGVHAWLCQAEANRGQPRGSLKLETTRSHPADCELAQNRPPLFRTPPLTTPLTSTLTALPSYGRRL